MSWWDSLGDSGSGSSFWGDLFSSGSGGDSGVGGDWTNYFGGSLGQGGGDNSDAWGLDWSNLLGGGDSSFGSGAGGGGSSSSSWITKLLGGSGGSGNGGSNIFGSLLSGLSSGAGSWLDSKNAAANIKLAGEQSRKSTAFTADLQDYYKQKDKVRKRVGLDTYGQFSQIKRWAPNYVDTPMPDQPAKPSPTGY